MIVISAQTFPPRSGGIEALMEGLASHCALAGHDVLVLADGQAGDDANQPYRIERFRGPRPLRRWAKARRLRKLAASGTIDAVYACSWKSVEVIGQKLPCPVVSFGHGNEFRPAKSDRIRAALGLTSALICVSNDTRARAAPMCPDDLRVVTIHPPVQQPDTASRADQDWAQAQYGNASPRVLALSRLIPLKGHDQTIRAVAALASDMPDIGLVLAGEGEDKERLVALTAQLGVSDRVTFAGRVEGGRKTALLQAADLFAQPGRRIGQEREGFGITYLEAALHGIPSVSGNKGGAPEALVDGTTGYVVDGENLDEVITAFRRILIDSEPASPLAQAARAHGSAALWTNMVGEILAVADLQDRRLAQSGEVANDPLKTKDM